MITTKIWFRETTLPEGNSVFYSNEITGKLDNYYLYTKTNNFSPERCLEYYDKPLAFFVIDRHNNIYFCLAIDEHLDECWEIYRYYKVSNAIYGFITKEIHVNKNRINFPLDYLFNYISEYWFDIKFMWRKDD